MLLEKNVLYLTTKLQFQCLFVALCLFACRSGHLISTGTYIHYMAEKDLVYNPKFKINSAVISLSIEPKPKSQVASDIIITFWHKQVRIIILDRDDLC